VTPGVIDHLRQKSMPQRGNESQAHLLEEDSPVFSFDIDMSIYFAEILNEHGRGIRVTRRFELPFVPHQDILLSSFSLNGDDIPMGYKINEITWDIDRQVFFGQTCVVMHATPIAFIPFEIRSWLKRGWRLGTYEDNYKKPDRRSTNVRRRRLKCEWNESLEDDVADEWRRGSPQSRPASFTLLLRAMVREMVKLHNNVELAFAIAKTGRFFEKFELKDSANAAGRKFNDAIAEFNRLPLAKMESWQAGILRKYPRLEQFLL
jgi:hypothetical protein